MMFVLRTIGRWQIKRKNPSRCRKGFKRNKDVLIDKINNPCRSHHRHHRGYSHPFCNLRRRQSRRRRSFFS